MKPSWKKGSLFSFLLLICSALSLQSCGESGGTNQFLKNFIAAFSQGKASLDVEFTRTVNINIGILKQIGDYGTMQFIPGTAGKGFRIKADLDVSVFADPNITLNRVSELPNGTPFPEFITSPELASYKFVDNGNWSGELYLGLEAGKKYLGASLSLNFVSQVFPVGLNIFVPLFSQDETEIGTLIFYGPQVDALGNVIEPGGIFVIVNLSDLIGGSGVTRVGDKLVNHIKVIDEGKIGVWSRDGRDLDLTDMKILYNRFRLYGQRAGLITKE